MYVFKPSRSRYYRGRYRLSDGPKWYDVPLRVEQKDVAKGRLRDLVREKEHELLGWIPAKLARDAAQTEIAVHLAEYVAVVAANGASKKHVALSRNRVGRLCRECAWRYVRDITPDGFERWLVGQNRAPKTSNEYLGLCSAFLNWMVKGGRIAANPLAKVQKARTRGRQRRIRRALTIEEFGRLLAVAGKREFFYWLATYTGLRRGETKKLMWQDLHLDGEKPYIAVRASTTKNGKQARQPLLPEVADMLKERLATMPQATGKVFPRGVPTAKALRADLAKAGIPAVDELGQRVDIHALRKTFCTYMHVAGVPQRIAQELMRHSEARLTNEIYTDAAHLPLHAELKKLARPAPSQTVSQKSVVSGVSVSIADQMDDGSDPAKRLFIKDWGHGAYEGSPCPLCVLT